MRPAQGRSLRLCAALEDREDGDPDERHKGRGSPVDAPPAPRALSRLLDQDLDEGLELLTVDGIARARRARRGSNTHGCTSDTIAIVLLAPC